MDPETLCAALLHDTVEDTAYGLDELRRDFGDDVAALVDGVTKLDKVKFGEAAQAETVRKMVVAMARDTRVLVIKLADRLHNMRTMRYLQRDKQEKKARETLEIYAPLAHRLGMNTIKWELEDLAFAILYPKMYDEIVRLVAERAPRRDDVPAGSDREGPRRPARRPDQGDRHRPPEALLLVYQKMIAGAVDFAEIYDLVGIRVLVDTVRDCYAALGTDPRAMEPGPRPVQGLHRDAEVQHVPVAAHDGDRSRRQAGRAADPHLDMHRRAEYGIAAHWKYKQEMVGSAAKQRPGRRPTTWRGCASSLDWQKETEDPAEFLESLRFDLSVNEVFVFTPKGDVIALPQGATPVDFAYAVHTEVGHRTIGARVNGRLVAAGVHPGQRRHGGGLHLQGARRRAVPRLARLRQVRPRPQQDPAVVLQGAPRERDRAGQGAIARAMRKQNLPLQRI